MRLSERLGTGSGALASSLNPDAVKIARSALARDLDLAAIGLTLHRCLPGHVAEHGERKVVDDVSFDVPADSSLAIVGRTGSGKNLF